jgi:hypothetical protein
MRTVLFSTALVIGVLLTDLVPAQAGPRPTPGLAESKDNLAFIEEIGWRRSYYRRDEYPLPYAYGYYPPPAYGVYWYRGAPGYPYYAPYAFPHYPPYPPGEPTRRFH